MPGPQRCALAARSGHPSAIEPLIELMSDPDALTAAAAGTAFTRITGLDIEARRQRLPTSADADDFEREFADEKGAEVALTRAADRGWTIISMRDDWTRVFAHD